MKKQFILFFSVICFIPFFASCQKKEVSLQFIQDSLDMSIEEVIDIESLITFKNVDFEDIKFVSSNNAKVYVEDGNLNAISSGVVFVTASYKNTSTNLEVEVKKEAVPAPVPTAVFMDIGNSTLHWNHSILEIDGKVVSANSYTIQIIQNGETKEFEVFNANKYKVEVSGEFEICVKANAYQVGESVVYLESEFSTPLKFYKLKSATDLTYDEATKTLTWAKAEGVDSYYVNVNGVQSELLTNCSYKLNLVAEENVKDFDIFVVSQKDEGENTIYLNSVSKTLKVSRLVAPQLKIENGALTFDRLGFEDLTYTISLVHNDGTTSTKNITSNVYDFKDDKEGVYKSVSLSVSSANKNVLPSLNKVELNNIEKLAKPNLQYNLATNSFVLQNYVANAKIKINDSIGAFNSDYNFAPTNAGDYFVCAYILGNSNQISSDQSNTIKIVKMNALNLQHKIDNNIYYLQMDNIDFLNEFEIEYQRAGDSSWSALKQQTDASDVEFVTYTNAFNTLFSQSGQYNVRAKSQSYQDSENEIYYLGSTEQIDVVRLANVANIATENTAKNINLTFDIVAGASAYNVDLFKLENSNWVKQGESFILKTPSHSISRPLFGKYKFEVSAISSNKYTEFASSKIILNSLDIIEVEFDNNQQLAIPKISFDKDSKVLTVEKVEFANSYDILIGDQKINYVDNAESSFIEIDISSKIEKAADYLITVVAKNTENVLLNNSESAKITIVKMDYHKEFEFNKQNKLVANNIQYAGVSTLKVSVDGVEVDISAFEFNEKETFEIETYYKAAEYTDGTNGEYILDSNKQTFNILRLAKPTNVVFENDIISFDESENGLYSIKIEQDGELFVFETDQNSISIFDDLFARIDKTKDIAFAVAYVFEDIAIDLTDKTDWIVCSNYTDMQSVQKIAQANGMLVKETDAGVEISWAQSAFDDVTYILKIDSSIVYEGTNCNFVSNEMKYQKKYNLQLQIKKEGCISSEITHFSAERLIWVTSFSILQDESLASSSNYESDKLEKVLFEINGQEVQDLKSQSGSFDVDVTLVAKKYTDGNKFYLNSTTNNFACYRIDKLAAPTVENGNLMFGTISGYTNYNVKFYDDEKENIVAVAERDYISSVEIEDILSMFNSNAVNACVMVDLGQVECSSSQTTFISSFYSDNAVLRILNKVENIEISTIEDVYQNNLVVSFDHTLGENHQIKHFEIEVYFDGAYLEMQTTTSKTFNYTATESGIYSFKIKAVAQTNSNCFSSKKVGSADVEKLASVTNIRISANGILYFETITLAQKYLVEVFYSNSIKMQEFSTSGTVDISSFIWGDEFDRSVSVKVWAIGNNADEQSTQTTISSEASNVFVFEKLSSAKADITTDGFTIIDSNANAENQESYLYTILVDDQIVEEGVMQADQKVSFKTAYTKTDGTQIDFSLQTIFKVEIVKQSLTQNTVNADKTVASATKLATVTNLGALKSSLDQTGKMYFAFNKVANTTNYTIVIEDVVYGVDSTSSQVLFEITNSILLSMQFDWTISVYANGTKGSTTYINSNIVQLSGQRLDTVKERRVENGVLAWAKNQLASDYSVVANGTYFSGYVTGDVHKTTESFVGMSGNLSINIKNIGNLSNYTKTENIILDSTFALDENNEAVANFDVSKLVAVEGLKVVEGYITFNKTGEQADYFAVVDGVEYNLSQIRVDDELIFRAFSEDMYSNLAVNTKYSLAISAKASTENVLHADVSNLIEFKIAENTVGAVTREFKKISNSPDAFDYTISYATWQDSSYSFIVNYAGTQYIQDENTFQIDKEGNLKEGTSYAINVAICGGSTPIGNVYTLNSKWTPNFIVTKLNGTAPYVENGLIAWQSTPNADNYYVYLDDQYYNAKNANSFYVDKKGTYERVELQSICKDATSPYIASNKNVYESVNESGNKEVVEVFKPDTVKKFEIDNGALLWNISNWDLISFGLKGEITSPFYATMENIMNQKLFLQFVSESGAKYSQTEYAAIFAKVPDGALDSYLDKYPDLADFAEYGGWPIDIYNYFELFSNIPSGDYSLFVKQRGNNLDQLETEWTTGLNVSIPSAPQIKISYDANSEEYGLSWKAVSVSSLNNVEYCVYGQTDNDEDGKFERKLLATTDQTSISLTSLINNKTLTEEFTKIFVFVKGNSNYTLNGKPSNVLDIEVLGEVTGKVIDGELSWDMPLGASEFKIEYTNTTNSFYSGVYLTTENVWNFEDSEGNLLPSGTYKVSITCVGDQSISIYSIKLSSAVTSLGNIVKLSSADVSIQNGGFVWDNIANSTSYKVYALDGTTEVSVTDVLFNINVGINSYYSQHTGQHLKYTVKTMGTINQTLDGTTTSYVNSNQTSGIYGTVIGRSTKVETLDGALSFEEVYNNGELVKDYILQFYKVNNSGEIVSEAIEIASNDFYLSSKGLCLYDGADLEGGKYIVYVYAYYTTNDVLGYYTKDGANAYYLRSVATEKYSFEKFEIAQTKATVYSQNMLFNGKFNFEYTGIKSANYMFELTFTMDKETYVYTTKDEFYMDRVVDELVARGTFVLDIRVVPTTGRKGFMSSDAIRYANITNDKEELMQIDGIEKDLINLTTKSSITGDDTLYISWEGYTPKATANKDLIALPQVTYLITYKTSNDNQEKTLETTNKYISVAEFDAKISNDYIIFYNIQVVPQGSFNFVISQKSETREIAIPSGVGDVVFDEQSQIISWVAKDASADHIFEIVDVVYKQTENGKLLLENGKPVVLRTYKYLTNNQTQTTYVPTEIGFHKVGVSVLVKNSLEDVSGTLKSSCVYYNRDGASTEDGSIFEISLFGNSKDSNTEIAANGTKNNPYLIEDSNMFNNLQFRYFKNSYQNAYEYQTFGQDDVTTVTNEENMFFFKQTKNIDNVQVLGYDDASMKIGYDGSKYAISYSFDNTNFVLNECDKIALFPILKDGGYIKSIKIYASFEGQLNTGATISLVTQENYGDISYLQIGKEGETLQFVCPKNIYVSGVANKNFGEVNNVVYNYNTNISVSSLSSSVGFAGITRQNDDTISMCGNVGNISITAIKVNIGGIVATNNATINQCYAKMKNISLTMPTAVVTPVVTLGALVALNSGDYSTVAFCYSSTTLNITRNTKQVTGEQIYMSAFIAKSDNSNISSCYVNSQISVADQSIDYGNLTLFGCFRGTGSGTRNFYNQGQKFTAVSGEHSLSINEVASYPNSTDLNYGSNNYFAENTNRSPLLSFEEALDNYWKA